MGCGTKEGKKRKKERARMEERNNKRKGGECGPRISRLVWDIHAKKETETEHCGTDSTRGKRKEILDLHNKYSPFGQCPADEHHTNLSTTERRIGFRYWLGVRVGRVAGKGITTRGNKEQLLLLRPWELGTQPCYPLGRHRQDTIPPRGATPDK
jgi:hypothetical protein